MRPLNSSQLLLRAICRGNLTDVELEQALSITIPISDRNTSLRLMTNVDLFRLVNSWFYTESGDDEDTAGMSDELQQIFEWWKALLNRYGSVPAAIKAGAITTAKEPQPNGEFEVGGLADWSNDPGIRLKGDSLNIMFRNEAELRDGLAKYAEMSGWTVETERHIPGWGRADLFLSTATQQYAVELKLELKRSAQIRKAFQQADCYAKALPGVEVILAAPDVDHDLAREYDLAYTDVYFMTASALLGWIRTFPLDAEERYRVAQDRYKSAMHDLQLRRRVLLEIGAPVPKSAAPSPRKVVSTA